MLKQIGKFITEPLRKGDKSRPLRWRLGMRLNHIHNDLHSNHPKLWNAILMTARTLNASRSAIAGAGLRQ